MDLITMDVENYRSIIKKTINFKHGITGLLGPNGSGKTSILSALCFGLTGLVLGEDTKSDLLNWNARKGFVRIKFGYADSVYVIKRNIQGSAVDLRREDASRAEFSSREAIDTFMLDLIGLHPRLYDKVLFIEQEGLDTLPRATHAKRMDFFNDLFDSTITEKLRDLIQSYIQRIRIYPDYTQEKESYYKLNADERRRDSELRQEHAKLTKALEELPAMQTILDASSKPSRKDVDDQIKAKQDKIQRLRKTADVLKGMSTPVFITPEREAFYQKYMMMQVKEETAQKASQALKDFQMPKKDKFIGDDPEKTWAELKAEAFNLTEKMKLCEQGKCPTCGKAYKGASKEKLVEDQKKVQDKLKIVLEYIRAGKDKTSLETKSQIAQHDLAEYLKPLTSDVLAFDYPSYRADIETISKQSMQIQEYREKEIQATSAEAEIINCNKEITELQKKEVITDVDKETYTEVLNTTKKIQDRQSIINRELTSISTSIKMRNERIKTILEDEKKAERGQAYLTLLTRVRDVLHRDCLPHVRVSVGLSYVNLKLAEWLSVFDVKFSMKINNNCDFMVSFEGTEKPFKVLSGGQKKVAAVAFRMAVAEIFGGNLGVLSLDEPTAYMDEDAKCKMVEILSKASARALALKMFVFVSTHEEMLSTAFNQTINMYEE